jgi:hypothetical protein
MMIVQCPEHGEGPKIERSLVVNYPSGRFQKPPRLTISQKGFVMCVEIPRVIGALSAIVDRQTKDIVLSMQTEEQTT